MLYCSVSWQTWSPATSFPFDAFSLSTQQNQIQKSHKNLSLVNFAKSKRNLQFISYYFVNIFFFYEKTRFSNIKYGINQNMELEGNPLRWCFSADTFITWSFNGHVANPMRKKEIKTNMSFPPIGGKIRDSIIYSSSFTPSFSKKIVHKFFDRPESEKWEDGRQFHSHTGRAQPVLKKTRDYQRTWNFCLKINSLKIISWEHLIIFLRCNI